MKTIVVPIDFSEGTSNIIEQAVLLAKAFSSVIYLVHVVLPSEDSSGKVKKGMEREFTMEFQDLNRLAKLISGQDIETHALLIEGVSAVAILKEAETVSADLIVMGVMEGGIVSRALSGDVSYGVLSKSLCPVLMVPINP
jgi:nucleotide-binding universal stress UspA family protein